MATQNHSIPIAVISTAAVGDAGSAASRVRCRRYRVSGSDIDLLSDLDRIFDFDAEIPHGTFDLRMPQQQLDRAQLACAPVDQHARLCVIMSLLLKGRTAVVA